MDFKILKFRSFVSKQEEGFVILFDSPIPQMIFEDILYQLFQPVFYDKICPQICYFSTTDQILDYSLMIKTKAYIYVHFLNRVRQYQQCYDKHGNEKYEKKFHKKFKLGDIKTIGQGIDFNGSNIYIFSEASFALYGNEAFRNMIDKKISSIPEKFALKQQAYKRYTQELQQTKDSKEFQELKQEVNYANKEISQKIVKLENLSNRYSKAKNSLKSILRGSGIQIRGVKDLF